jgi:hypothetical protein
MTNAERTRHELLLRLLTERRTGRPGGQRTAVQPRTGLFPTSSGQEGLWFVDRLEPDSVQYAIPLAFRLRGPLAADALATAVNRVVDRHESLRTTFVEDDGQPRQHVHPPRGLDLPVTDLSGLPPAARAAELTRLMDDAELPVFDLATGPLFTARLIRLAPADHVLVLCAHHIVFDGWSLNIVLNELAEDYRAEVAGEQSTRTAPEFQFADYAIEQRDWLGGAEYRAQLDYWRAELAGLPEVLDLGPRRTRPKVRDDAGAWHPVEFDEPLTTRVRELCAQEQITVFMYLMTVLSLVLARWSGRADIAVGATVANRRSVREQALVGYLANTVVVRTDLGGNPTHRGLLHRVREVALRAYAHQELPFDHVVQALRPRRRLDSTPIFQVMLAFQDNAARDLSWGGVTVEEITRTTATCMFDLTLVLNAEGGRVTGALNYRTDLFDEPEIRQLADDFQAAARDVVAAPEQHVGPLPRSG